MKDIQVSGLHYDRSVNKTFAVVRTSDFTTTFYVSGEVSAADFARGAFDVGRFMADRDARSQLFQPLAQFQFLRAKFQLFLYSYT